MQASSLRHIPSALTRCAHGKARRRSKITIRTSCTSSKSPSSQSLPNANRYAIIGAGLAGLSTAWHLVQQHEQLPSTSASDSRPLEILVIDAYGIGAGGSGSAAGLLHPFNSRGKLLWMADEAMKAAVNLAQVAEAQVAEPKVAEPKVAELKVAEAPLASTQSKDHSDSPRNTQTDPVARKRNGLFWRHGLVRPAASPKQARDFAKAYLVDKQSRTSAGPGKETEGHIGQNRAMCLTPDQLQQLIPGIALPGWLNQPIPRRDPEVDSIGKGQSVEGVRDSQRGGQVTGVEMSSSRSYEDNAKEGMMSNRQKKKLSRDQGPTVEELAGSCSALHIPEGMVLDVPRYLEVLWEATKKAIESRADGSSAKLLNMTVRSLGQLDIELGPFTAMVVAAGAAAGTIKEVSEANVPLELCQGYTLIMEPRILDPSASGHSKEPNHDASDASCQPPLQHDVSDVSARDASCQPVIQEFPVGAPSILGQTYLSALGPSRLVIGATRSFGWSPLEALELCGPEARRVNPGDGLCGRAETSAGELLEEAAAVWPPLRGWKIREIRSGMRALPPRTAAGSVPIVGRLPKAPKCWLIVGLGARGLVYHSWLGQILARAVILDDENMVQPSVLRSWQSL